MDVNGTFGLEKGNTWKPFTYAEREKVAKEVVTFKVQLSKRKKKVKAATKRKNLTDFIRERDSRQEILPLVGRYVSSLLGTILYTLSLHKTSSCDPFGLSL